MKKPPLWRVLLLLVLLVACAAFAVKRYFGRAPGPSGLPVAGGVAMEVRIEVAPFLQWDKRWSEDRLGRSSGNLGQTGCTVCAMSMALVSQGFQTNPAELNKLLLAKGGFTDSGLLIWGALPAVTKGKFGVRVEDRPSYEMIDGQLAKGNPVLAKVLFGPGIWHWVLICGKKDRQYLMNDPLGAGRALEDMRKYREGIFAVRYLDRV